MNTRIADGRELQPNPPEAANVRYGSLADIDEPVAHVRFTPESGHAQRQTCPLSAISGHCPDDLLQSGNFGP